MMNDIQKEKTRRLLSKVGDISFHRRVRKVLEYLDIQEGDRILDCGCGEGFYTMLIRELYGESCTVVSLDRDLPLMCKARAWLGQGGAGIFVSGDAEKLPFQAGSFNKIIFTEVLEHVRDDAGALAEIKRVLAPSGVVALTVPNHNYPFLWDPLNWIREACNLGHFDPENGLLGGLWAMHLRLYTLEELEALLDNGGFSVIKKEMITHYSLPFNHLILYVGKRLGNVIPLSDAVAKSIEKFDWREDHKGIMPSLIRWATQCLYWIDRKNDDIEHSYEISSVCIGMKLVMRPAENEPVKVAMKAIDEK